jgi:hypothetical protein
MYAAGGGETLSRDPVTLRNWRIDWAPPLLLCAAMLLVALAVAVMAGIDPTALFYPYLYASFGMTILAILAFVFIEIARLARKRADRPLPTVGHRLHQRLDLLILPFLLFPLFLIGFTTGKTGIPFLVGYGWERYWADVDAAIFGSDVWQLARLLAPEWSLRFWELSYTAAWGIVTYSAVGMLTLYASRRTVFIFFSATFATWLIGGWLVAYAFSAAGPVFAHLADPSLQERFSPLHDFLAANFAENGPIRFTQRYLEAARFDHNAVKGGGISAMPSMHLGMVALLVIAAWRSRWLLPAIAFWLVIFIGSGLFGYHYWVDGIVGAAIAGAAWWAASAYYREIPKKRARATAIEADLVET